MNKLKALLFDVDGTLADTERDGHRVAFNRAFADADLNWEWGVETYGRLLTVTGGRERIRFFINDFLEGFTIPAADKDAWIASLHNAKTRHYLRMLQDGAIPLRPGVGRLLDEARVAGLRLGIATTTTPENVTYLLKAALGEASLQWFDVIAAGDSVAAKKPAPDIYHYAMKKLDLRPDECIAFEDSVNGLRSAKSAALKTIITINGYTAREHFIGADLILDNMGEPDAPFTVISGDARGKTYLALELVRRISETS